MEYREKPLTHKQQLLVEMHLSLVDTVIKNRIRIDESVIGLSYEDLRQEGYILLCQAMKSYNPEKSKITTYAGKVIYNGLVSYCRRINRLKQNLPIVSLDDTVYDILEANTAWDKYSRQMSDLEVFDLLSAFAQRFTGISRLGIEALIKKLQGATITEIAQYYHVPPSHVGAWISRAVRKLQNNNQFLKEIA